MVRYFKSQNHRSMLWALGRPEYYRVFPDDRYEFRTKNMTFWECGTDRSWKCRVSQWIRKPVPVSKLEVLIQLGPEAVTV